MRHKNKENYSFCWMLTAIIILAMMQVSVLYGGANSFTVTGSGNNLNYSIDGQPDPNLTLVRGLSYTFDVSAPNHPFWIKTAQSTGSSNRYDDGVTNNGTQNGTITFNVPLDAPDQLFYNCGNHASMTGELNIIDGADDTILLDGFES